METLPVEAPEAVAIPWTVEEVRDFLAQGGFAAHTATYEKAVRVYQVQVRRAAEVDAPHMLRSIAGHIQSKLDAALKERQ